MAKVYMRSYLLIRVLLLKGHLVVKGVTSGGLLGLKLRFRVETGSGISWLCDLGKFLE